MTVVTQARGVVVITPPATEPLSLSTVKSWLRVEHSDEDALLNRLISAAREQAEHRCTKALITQTREITYHDNAPQDIALAFGPVQSITSVKTVDAQGTETTLATTRYALSADNSCLQMDSALCAEKIIVRYVSGFGDTENDVPSDIAQAMLQHIAMMYGSRETVLPPLASVTTYAQYRGVRV